MRFIMIFLVLALGCTWSCADDPNRPCRDSLSLMKCFGECCHPDHDLVRDGDVFVCRCKGRKPK